MKGRVGSRKVGAEGAEGRRGAGVGKGGAGAGVPEGQLRDPGTDREAPLMSSRPERERAGEARRESAGGFIFRAIRAQEVVAGRPVEVWRPTEGRRFRLLGFMVSLSVAGSVVFLDGEEEFLRTPLMPGGMGTASPTMGQGYLSRTNGAALRVDVTGSGSVSGFVWGREE